MPERFCCDICGRMRSGLPVICPICLNAVCERCLNNQAKVGHMEAEHRHEMALDGGYYSLGVDGDE